MWRCRLTHGVQSPVEIALRRVDGLQLPGCFPATLSNGQASSKPFLRFGGFRDVSGRSPMRHPATHVADDDSGFGTAFHAVGLLETAISITQSLLRPWCRSHRLPIGRIPFTRSCSGVSTQNGGRIGHQSQQKHPCTADVLRNERLGTSSHSYDQV